MVGTMNKVLVNFLCFLCIWFSGLLYGGLVMPQMDTQSVTISFPEPMVSASTVWAEQETQDAESARLFRITGDSRHVPQARWKDQDTLELRFPPGTSCLTSYQLELLRDACFLSGKKPEKRRYSFRCPPNRLASEAICTAQGMAVLVTPRHWETRESQQFSEKSAIRYEFRRVKRSFWTGDRYLGRRVAATAEPARVCDGVMEESLERLAAAGQGVWGKLRADSRMPGHVLVRPVEELDTDETWVLCYEGAPNSGFVARSQDSGEEVPRCCQSVDFQPVNELLSGVSVEPAAPDASSVELTLYFSQPVPKKTLTRLFSELEFRVEGAGVQERVKDGIKLELENHHSLHFRYIGLLPYRAHGVEITGGDTTRKLAYQAGGMASGIRMRVSGHLPAIVDVGVPQGIAAANGAALREKHVHRIALNPAWPRLATDSERVTVLPLKGNHCLRLPVSNVSAVDVTLRRVSSHHVTEVMTQGKYDSRKRDEARYCYRIARKRDSEGLKAGGVRDFAEKTYDSEEDAQEARAEDRTRWFADAEAFPSRRLDMKGSALYRSSELVLDMDSLSGKKLQPGLYLVTLKVTPNAHVQRALAMHRLRVDSLHYELDIPVLVTDLNVICSETGVLVTRFSDGSVVTDAELKALEWNQARCQFEEKSLPYCSGVAFVKAEGKTIIARSGADFAWGTMPGCSASEERQRQTTRMFLLTERSLYRPGDTVRIRGLVRSFRNELACLPREKNVQLSVSRPNGEKLLEQSVALSDYGAFAAEVKLPEGEEDVAGDYRLMVKCGAIEGGKTIACQVFRRDAFKTALTVDVDKVAPKKIMVNVQAADYSGIPLCSAKTELCITAGDAEEKHHVVTDASGTATLELEMKEEWLREGLIRVSGSVCNDREEYVQLPAQVREFSPADFRISCSDAIVRLTDAETGAALAREQKIRIELKTEGWRPLKRRSCFTLMEPDTVTLHSCVLSIPADSAPGFPLPDALLQAVRQQMPQDYYIGDVPPLYLELRGTDAAGREAYCRVSPHDVDSPGRVDLLLRAEPRTGALRLHFHAPHKGVVHVFIGCGERLRHTQYPVEQGSQELDIRLLRHEEGRVSVSLVLPECGRKATTDFLADTTSCFVTPLRNHLDVSLQVPQAASRPGQKVALSGRVLANGKPADAEVTLYAVDAGMLSLRQYERPDPERFFACDQALTFSPRVEPVEKRILSGEMMDAVWQGDMVEGEALSLSPYFSNRFHLNPATMASGHYGIITDGLRSGSGMMVSGGDIPPWLVEADSYSLGEMLFEVQACAPAPAGFFCYTPPSDTAECVLRSNFEPVAVWRAALRTDAEGCFSVEAELPDTLTTYRVFAVAADRSGSRFGSTEASFVVNLPVMITPGVPLFMSTGDRLKLPLSITNATETDGTWTVSLEGCSDSQQIVLPAGGSGTLYFEVAPTQEGECSLQWKAVGASGTDAVQGTCRVRFPAPLLKETHRLQLLPGQAPQTVASLFASEVAEATRSEVQIQVSASPLLHLRGVADFLLEYPYGCTEQRASALLPWLLYDELAPFCPLLASTPREKVKNVVEREINALFARQCKDGGLGYWSAGNEGCAWASAYAAMALTIASERGYAVPLDKMKRLMRFVDSLDDDDLFMQADIAAARSLGDKRRMLRCLEKDAEYQAMLKQEGIRPGVRGATVLFLKALLEKKNTDEAFRDWLRTVGRDYRHGHTPHSALVLLALHDYLRQQPIRLGHVELVTETGRYTLGREPMPLPLPSAAKPADLPTTLAAEGGTVFALVQAKAQPEQTSFPGVTEKGLQVTRLYEVKGEDGKWHPAPAQLKVGDVVRVTLTCAKVSEEMEYLVLEDYLPACMEAINPEVPSQAAGLEFVPWSRWFDHREYLADRVRGFCTRWSDRDLLNMTYFARVKRAGVSTAPPAQAQLMYEPQVYGLSPNARVTSEPAE